MSVLLSNICTFCKKPIDPDKLNLIDTVAGKITCEDCIFGDEEE